MKKSNGFAIDGAIVGGDMVTYRINDHNEDVGHAFYCGAIDVSQLDQVIIARAVMILDLNKYVFGKVSDVQSAIEILCRKPVIRSKKFWPHVDFFVNINTYDATKPR